MSGEPQAVAGPGGPQPDGGPDPERDPKVRRTWRIVLVGAITGAALAVLSGILGGDGRVGFVVLFLVTSLSTGVAALYAGLTAVIDDLKGRPVARSRVVSAVGLFALTAVLMALVAGAGG